MKNRVIYTIGFTKKSAKRFFELLKTNGVTLVADVRLNNRSQLAGYTKSDDLAYFLSLVGVKYQHWPEFAPTKSIRDAYHASRSFEDYASAYAELLESREAVSKIPDSLIREETICLLCSESEAERCHRRLAAEAIAASVEGMTIKHL